MLSSLYGKIMNLRGWLYERGAFKSYALGAKTVSVGNITVGGTGKTPLVALVSEILADAGETICIISRGYGRKNPKTRVLVSDGERVLTTAPFAGDEPFELAGKLLGKAIVIADADRVAAAAWARDRFGATVFVLDDAFQHRRARRDLDIVCIDALNPFGNRKTLPFGILREPLENLRRAGAIVITRSDLVEKSKLEQLKTEIEAYAQCPIFSARSLISKIIELNDFHHGNNSAIENPKSEVQNPMAFCALGNPRNFFEQLRRENFALCGTETFPDHHFYAPKDIEKIEKSAREKGARALLTTAKDAVKLRDLKFELPCYVAESETIFDDAENFRKLIENLETG